MSASCVHCQSKEEELSRVNQRLVSSIGVDVLLTSLYHYGQI